MLFRSSSIVKNYTILPHHDGNTSQFWNYLYQTMLWRPTMTHQRHHIFLFLSFLWFVLLYVVGARIYSTRWEDNHKWSEGLSLWDMHWQTTVHAPFSRFTFKACSGYTRLRLLTKPHVWMHLSVLVQMKSKSCKLNIWTSHWARANNCNVSWVLQSPFTGH